LRNCNLEKPTFCVFLFNVMLNFVRFTFDKIRSIFARGSAQAFDIRSLVWTAEERIIWIWIQRVKRDLTLDTAIPCRYLHDTTLVKSNGVIFIFLPNDSLPALQPSQPFDQEKDHLPLFPVHLSCVPWLSFRVIMYFNPLFLNYFCLKLIFI